MGYSYNSINRLRQDKKFFQKKDILTLGTLFPFLNRREASKLNREGVLTNIEKKDFSKHLFQNILGANICHSLDVSDYQQSEIITNLNFPIPDELKGNYDVIYDAGTLEHISDLTTGIRNIFSLLKNDGIYYFGVPCNNWIDHGFFQFSPTFFIDLCGCNKNLELETIFLSTKDSYFEIEDLSPRFSQLIYSSNDRFNVGGIIRKIDEDITLDLIQTKYGKVYIDSDSSTQDLLEIPPAKYLYLLRQKLSELIFWILSFPFISLINKLKLLKKFRLF